MIREAYKIFRNYVLIIIILIDKNKTQPAKRGRKPLIKQS